MLYVFVIAAPPAFLAGPRWGLPIVVGLCLFANLCALSTLGDFRTFTDCGITSGNDENSAGDYFMFFLSYALLVLALYALALVGLVASGVRTLHRMLVR